MTRAVHRIVATAALALATAACGGTQGSQVAQLGATSTVVQSTGSMLAYARCMRSHGVPAFPDPGSNGQIFKSEIVNVQKADPSRFDSAGTACRSLLPPGGNGETPAEIAQDWTDFRAFARCMRSHGVPNWPDPTSRSATDRRPAFAITAVGIDGNAPQIRAKAQQCVSKLKLDGLPAAH